MKPWFMHPAKTLKVLNRLANRFSHQPLTALHIAVEQATDKIWFKQQYFTNHQQEVA